MKTEYKVIGGIMLLTAVIIAGGAWLSGNKDTENQVKLAKPLLGEKMPDMGAQHIARGQSHPEYNSNPPTSGWHWAGTAGPGIKNERLPTLPARKLCCRAKIWMFRLLLHPGVIF